MKRLSFNPAIIFAILAFVLMLVACGDNDRSTATTPTPGGLEATQVVGTVSPTGTAGVASPTATPIGGDSGPSATATPVLDTSARLASHLFIPIGEWRSIAGLGELLGFTPFTQEQFLVIGDDVITAVGSGMGCLRFKYRDVEFENGVQTLCVVTFEETGDCEGLPSLSLDLQTFLESNGQPVGNADLLESGEGLFYAVCETVGGAFRLQRTIRNLPTLYFTIVDALGDGPYSLGLSEVGMQRNGVVTTFGGEELEPSWTVPVSFEIEGIVLTEALRVEFEAQGCDNSPGCTLDPRIVRPGDFLSVNAGIPPELLETAFDEAAEALRDRFFEDRIGLGWSEISQVHPDAWRAAFNRLVVLDIMTDTVRYFGELYGATDKGVRIAWAQPWNASQPITFPYACFPDDVQGETERCEHIEAAIRVAEAARIAELQGEGYEIWYSGNISYDGDGEYASLSTNLPEYENFDGLWMRMEVIGGRPIDDVPVAVAVANAVRGFAAEVGPDVPVLISLSGPPITAQTGGEFCEAEICPSDFAGMYAFAEAGLEAALSSLSRRQFVGFSVALFEGSHFDIRNPYEQFPGFMLNRVGETGYNNPVLNIYRAR